ncbi:MAG: class I SAM-dependent methyltransferase [Candidatus Riflebacteria bacterium]|nr:class I SAM-dependent methyltransferase [Candidatus Riflebacteria bacterium]
MNCPLCGRSGLSEWARSGAYSVLFCSDCRMGMTSPLPTEDDLARVNAENYRVEDRITAYLDREKMFELRYEGVLRRIGAFRDKGRLLDIGCNIGKFLDVAKRRNYETTGVEINSACAEFGRKKFGLEIHDRPLNSIGFPTSHFDVVTLFDVLEHIPDGGSFLAEIRRILKPDGLLVVQLPNLESSMAELTRKDWYWLAMPDHIFHFTPKSIVEYLSKFGFSILKVRTWDVSVDFANNVLTTIGPSGFFGRCLRYLLRISRLIEFIIRIQQQSRLKIEKGALIEVYGRPS